MEKKVGREQNPEKKIFSDMIIVRYDSSKKIEGHVTTKQSCSDKIQCGLYALFTCKKLCATIVAHNCCVMESNV